MAKNDNYKVVAMFSMISASLHGTITDAAHLTPRASRRCWKTKEQRVSSSYPKLRRQSVVARAPCRTGGLSPIFFIDKHVCTHSKTD